MVGTVHRPPKAQGIAPALVGDRHACSEVSPGHTRAHIVGVAVLGGLRQVTEIGAQTDFDSVLCGGWGQSYKRLKENGRAGGEQKKAYRVGEILYGGYFAGAIFKGAKVAPLGNPKAATASRTPVRASPCSVQRQKDLQIKWPLKAEH